MAELRITHAQTGAEDVFADAEIGAGALETRVEVADGRVERGDLAVALLASSLLGAGSKPLPDGRHRAVVTEGGPDGPRVLGDGTVSNESAAHGPPHALPEAGTREWSLVVRRTAAVEAEAALEAVLVEDVVRGTNGLPPLPFGVLEAVDLSLSTGSGVEPAAGFVYRLAGLVQACMEAAGLTVLPLPIPFPSALAASPDVVVGSPQVHSTSGSGLYAWTGLQLVDAWAAAQRLVLDAEYGPYPSRQITVSLRPAYWVEPTAAVSAALPRVEDADGASWRWTTEPAVDDGHPMSDLAVYYAGGPDGSYVLGQLVVSAPDVYAAARRAIDTYDDGRREVTNRDRVELGWRFGCVDGSQAETLAGGEVVAPPLVYQLGYERADPDAVTVWTLLDDSGGATRALGYRAAGTGPEARIAHELWACELYGRFSLEAGDLDVARVELLAPTLLGAGGEPYEPVLLDAARGLSLEGLPWAVRSWREDEHGRVDAELVRPNFLAECVGAAARAEAYPPPLVSAGPHREGSVDLYWQVPVSAPDPVSVETNLYVGSDVAPQETLTIEGVRSGGVTRDTTQLGADETVRYTASVVYRTNDGQLTPPIGPSEVTVTVNRTTPPSTGGGAGSGGDGPGSSGDTLQPAA